MERRYLAATIAMAATFALFSHAFSSGLLNRVQDPRPTLISEIHCAAQTLRARLFDKVNRSLGAGTAEEAQLRVELNLGMPLAPAAAAVAPALPASRSLVAPAAPAIPASPRAIPASAFAACPSQRLMSDVHLSRDFERAQARAMKMQTKALATQAKLIAVQARLTSQAMQRELARAAVAQAHADIAQARMSRSFDNPHAVRVRAGDREVDVNLDGLSERINNEVQRSLETVRNF